VAVAERDGYRSLHKSFAQGYYLGLKHKNEGDAVKIEFKCRMV